MYVYIYMCLYLLYITYVHKKKKKRKMKKIQLRRKLDIPMSPVLKDSDKIDANGQNTEQKGTETPKNIRKSNLITKIYNNNILACNNPQIILPTEINEKTDVPAEGREKNVKDQRKFIYSKHIFGKKNKTHACENNKDTEENERQNEKGKKDICSDDICFLKSKTHKNFLSDKNTQKCRSYQKKKKENKTAEKEKKKNVICCNNKNNEYDDNSNDAESFDSTSDYKDISNTSYNSVNKGILTPLSNLTKRGRNKEIKNDGKNMQNILLINCYEKKKNNNEQEKCVHIRKASADYRKAKEIAGKKGENKEEEENDDEDDEDEILMTISSEEENEEDTDCEEEDSFFIDSLEEEINKKITDSNWEKIVYALGIEENKKLEKQKKKLKDKRSVLCDKYSNEFQASVSIGNLLSSFDSLQKLGTSNVDFLSIKMSSEDEQLAFFSNKSNITYRALEATLGNKNLRLLVKLPQNCDEKEWIAYLSYQCYKELQVCCSVIWDNCTCPAFTAGEIKYGQEETGGKRGENLTALKFIEKILAASAENLKNASLFPIHPEESYPKNFLEEVKKMNCSFFKVYAHLYRHHFDLFWKYDAVAHLNCFFKHFLYFCVEFDLVNQQEFLPLKNIVDAFLGVRGGPLAEWRKGVNADTFSKSIESCIMQSYDSSNNNCDNNNNNNNSNDKYNYVISNIEEKINQLYNNNNNEKKQNEQNKQTKQINFNTHNNDGNNSNNNNALQNKKKKEKTFMYINNIEENNVMYDTVSELLKHVCKK